MPDDVQELEQSLSTAGSGDAAGAESSASAAESSTETTAETDEVVDGEEESEGEPLSPEQYERQLARTRGQAAKYRRERNEARARIAELEQHIATQQQQAPGAPAADDAVATATAQAETERRRADRLVAAMGAGVGLEALQALDRLASASDVQGMTQALQDARQALAGPTAGNPVPPGNPSTPLTLDDQIAQARAAGKIQRVMELQAQKALSARR